ncbi:MAG TPA: hypothetical protein VGH63_07205, partial [Polyangia bacterium]
MRAFALGQAFALVLVLSGTAAAQQSPSSKEIGADDDPKRAENASLHRELDEMRARQRWLEQRLSATEARLPKAATRPLPPILPPPPPENGPPTFHWGRGGFVFGTPDGKTELRVRATFNLDGHAYFGDVNPLPDTFLIRRARPFIEGTLWDTIDFRLMPDFSQGTATILDAWVDLRPWRWLQ